MRDEFERILRYWFDRGVAGFRVDVAHALIKDRELRDGVRYQRERPEVHEIYAGWQAIAARVRPEAELMGETYVELPKLWAYAQHLDLVQNFPFLKAELTRRRAAADRRAGRGEAAGRPGAGLVRLEPRPLAARDALGAGRRAQGSRRALPAADAARQRDPLPGRRARARGRRRSRRANHRRRRSAARPGAHADALDADGRGVAAARGYRSRTRRGMSRSSAPIRPARSTTFAS